MKTIIGALIISATLLWVGHQITTALAAQVECVEPEEDFETLERRA